MYILQYIFSAGGTMETKILIADDEELLRELIRDFLIIENYTVLEAKDGKEALDLFEEKNPDLVILDVMMPIYDGWTVCRQIRQSHSTPIIMLTAKGEELDQLLGFDLGVDEYITKPFSPKVLVARIKALLRRSANFDQKNDTATQGLVIDDNARQVMLDNIEINLSPKEYELLMYLSANQGKALSRQQILDKVWDYDYYGDLRTVDTHINRLRNKLGPQGSRIQTIRGYGYRFEDET